MSWFGGKRAIQQLVEDHYAPLYRFAYRLSGSLQEAEDLTQEAFCQAQAKLGQLRDPAKARSWLFSILRNSFRQKHRSDKRQQSLPPEALAEVPDRLPDPLPVIDPAKLQQALAELPEDFRVPLLLFYFEDFSYREIADQLQVPLGTVMSRLARAKAYLRGRLLQPAEVVLLESVGE
ncbi:MAG: RNA polymerase sigma factor [Gemmataceae bacterium]|nr:RNA polymerase sigma factor [Gemmataceae bacterium]